jgi:hypothetical protein
VTVASLLLIVGAVAMLGYGLLDGSNTYLVGSILMSLFAALALVIGSRRGGKAAVAAAVAEERSRNRRRNPSDELVGAGAVAGSGGRRGDRLPVSEDDIDTVDTPVRANRETEVIDLADLGVGQRTAPPADDRYDYTADYGDLSADPYAQDSYDDRYAASPQSATQPGPPAGAVLDDDDDDEEDPADEPPAQRLPAADAARVAQLDADVLVIDGRPRYHLPGCVHLLGRDSEPLPVNEAVELGFTPCGLCEPDSALLARARRV